MTLSFSAMLLVLFGISLVLITLSLRYLRGTGNDSTNSFAKFFLVALRLAIGWHCFIEGMEKINSPTWSSEAYLREALGPLAPFYRDLAGDRLLDKVTVGEDGAFPAELALDWQIYLESFAAHYKLDADQLTKARAIVEKQKTSTLAYLKSGTETVTKISAFPPALELTMTMKQRITEHERLLERVHAVEAKFPSDDKDIHTAWKNAKADLAKWRGELKKSLDGHGQKLRVIDKDYKEKILKNIDAINAKLKKTTNATESAKLQREIDTENGKLWTPLSEVLTSEQKLLPPMRDPPLTPMTYWRGLEWSDFAVKWGLLVLGAMLMLGLLSRISSFGTAILILSFYLAMPPLPGWPESPRLEGHYLLINKTLIEVIALFALTFIPTGRWAGIDGLLCACCGSNNQAPG